MSMAKAPGSWSSFWPRLLAWVLGFGYWPSSMDIVGTGFFPGYLRGLLVHVVDPRLLVQFYGPGFCPGFLAWVLAS